MARWSSLICAGLLVGCGGGSLPPSMSYALVGKAAPAHTELAIDGRQVQLPPPGKVVVLDFWGTWCAPCLRMMPALDALARGEPGVVVMGVAQDDNPGLVVEKVKSLGLSYPVVIDPSHEISGRFFVSDLPHTVVIDRNGIVRWATHDSEPDVAQIRRAVEVLLSEGEAAR